MVPDPASRIERICHAALALDAAARGAFVADACAGDEMLRREVESLLRQQSKADGFLAEPALEAAAHRLASESGPALIGRQLGAYRVLSLLGAGGMGEVYRARDTTLGRDVAIKVLPRLFVTEPERLARFEREARMLASLNHPHIGAIYGLEKVDGIPALVLELIEGPTLADRIALGGGGGGPEGPPLRTKEPRTKDPVTADRRGGPSGPESPTRKPARWGGDPPMSLDEALSIAKQICEALEAAHERGIIHRDLKPANIKITPDGMVKVLDFGLAKAVRADSEAGVTESPIVTIDGTREGVLLGTAAYMSPEQARGNPVDKRTDIWAFGCVLFAMLTGRAAFAGDTQTDTLAAVIEREPDWTALPASVPPAIRALLRRCLEKDRRKRLGDIAGALFVLDEEDNFAAGGQGPAEAGHDERSTWRRVATHGATALVAFIVVGAGVWMAMRQADTASPRVSRLLIAPSGAAALTIGRETDLAITPDGSRVIYVGNNGTQLFVRALDALEPVAVFTGRPSGPFVSPDGQWIGFVDNSTTLKKVAVTGGPAVTLVMLDVNTPEGATWAPDDTIIFATANAPSGLQRVSAAGGPTTVLTRPDRAGEWYLFPEMLPGGRAVLFTASAPGDPDAPKVAVLDLQTGMRTILVRGGSHAHYVSNGRGSPARAEREGGHLVYVAAGALRAVPFDLASLQTRGTPVSVILDVVTKKFGAMDAVVADDGTLAYMPGAAFADVQQTLVWVDRQGRETPIPAPPRAYTYPRLSPDGTRAVVWASDEDLDLWIWDLGRTTLTRITFELGLDNYPVWTPDGRRLIFTSDRAGPRNLFRQAADGTGTVERLTESPNQQYASAVSPDGRYLMFTETAKNTGEDVMQLELGGTHRVTPLVQSSFVERNGIVSPDGRWLAYEANDSGRFEIHVRPFPEVNRGHWQVSTGGGTRPLWTRSGQELVYVSPAGALMRVGVERAPSWAAAPPTLLVKDGYNTTGGNLYFGRSYDIAPDGQRFLMIKNGGGVDPTAAHSTIIVVQHWSEELRRLVPLK